MFVRQLGRLTIQSSAAVSRRAASRVAQVSSRNKGRSARPKARAGSQPGKGPYKWVPEISYENSEHAKEGDADAGAEQMPIMDEAKRLRRKDAMEDLIKMSELVMLTNQRTKRGLWELADMSEAMKLYEKHKDILDDEIEVAYLLQGLCNSARQPGQVFTSETKNERDRLKEHVHEGVRAFLNVIAHDIETGVVSAKPWGLMMLFAGYHAAGSPVQGADMYRRLVAAADAAGAAKQLKRLRSPVVCGAVLDCMIAAGSPVDQCVQLYETSRAESSATNAALEQNMCRAYLRAGETDQALNVFSNLVASNLPPHDHQYLDRIHNAFVQWADVEIAQRFVAEAAAGSTPYKVALHPNAVHELMSRMTAAPADEIDLDALVDVWAQFFEGNTKFSERQSNILTFQLFTAVFKKHPDYSEAAFERLRAITSRYSEIHGLSAMFINTLLGITAKHWREEKVVTGIIDSYQSYGIEFDAASPRVILRAYRYLDSVSVETIAGWWKLRLSQSRPLEVLDFYALSFACDAEHRAQFFADALKSAFADGTLSERDVLSIRSFATGSTAAKRLHHVLNAWPDLSS